jgi:hypothetical protein
MSFHPEEMQIVITPRVYVSLGEHADVSHKPESKPIQSNIPMAWIQDGTDFRLDITLPDPSVLEILFPMTVEMIHINGEIVWRKSAGPSVTVFGTQVEVISAGLQLTCTAGGALHILATFADKSEPMRNEIRKGAN